MRQVTERSCRLSANLPLTIEPAAANLAGGKTEGGRIVRQRMYFIYYILLLCMIWTVVAVSKLDGASFTTTVGRHALVRRRARAYAFSLLFILQTGLLWSSSVCKPSPTKNLLSSLMYSSPHGLQVQKFPSGVACESNFKLCHWPRTPRKRLSDGTSKTIFGQVEVI